MIGRVTRTATSEQADQEFAELLEKFARIISEDISAGNDQKIEAFLQLHEEHQLRLRTLLPTMRAMAGVDSTADSRNSAAEAASLEGMEDGKTLGDFRILRELGRGGMGVVYEAEQLSLGRRVAIKVLPFAALLGEQQLKRFKNEARAAATLKHPHIVSVYSVGCDRGVHHYAMELVQGESLDRVISQLQHENELRRLPSTPVPPGAEVIAPLPEAATVAAALSTRGGTDSPAYFRTVARLGAEAADALQHAHELGIVHRDIKPGNLIVDHAGKLWITDFGLARIEADAGLTMTGDVLGTLRYMSPEQVLDKGIVDHRSDVYSLGVTLYELATLQPAYAAADRKQLLRDMDSIDPRPPREINPRIPVDLDTIIRKATERGAADRYVSAGELADDLRRFLASEPIRARRVSLSSRMAKWSRRHVALVWSVAAMLLFSTLVLTLSSIQVAGWYREAEQQRDRANVQLEETQKQEQTARAVSELLLEILASANPDSAKGKEYTVRQLLDDFSAGLGEQLSDQPEVEAAVHSTMGKAYQRLGLSDQAESHLTAAIELRRRVFGSGHVRVADSLVDYAFYLYDRSPRAPYDEIIAPVQQALTIYRESEASAERMLYGLQTLQLALSSQASISTGRFEEVEAVAEEALTIAGDLNSVQVPAVACILHTHSRVLNDQRKFREADATARQAVALHRRLHGDQHPETAWGLIQLAATLQSQQQFDEAESVCREAVAIFRHQFSPEHSYVRRATEDLIAIVSAKGDSSQLELLVQELVAALDRQLVLDPDSAELWNLRGLYNCHVGQYQEGSNDFRKMLECDPKVSSPGDWYQASLAQLAAGDEETYRRMCAIMASSIEPSPDPTQIYWVARSCSLAGDAIIDPAPLLELTQELATREPTPSNFQTLGALLYRAGRYEEAIVTLQQVLSQTSPTYAHYFLALAHHQLGRAQQARDHLALAIEMAEAELHTDSPPPWYRRLTLRLLQDEAEALIDHSTEPDGGDATLAP